MAVEETGLRGAQLGEVPRIPWRQHFQWLVVNWEPGQHVAVVVKTGGGKSYLVRYGLLPVWMLGGARVLVFDNKDDAKDTMGDLGTRITGYPSDESEEGGPDEPWRIYRLIVPDFEFDPNKRSSVGLKRARAVAGTALDRAYQVGNWVLDLDETRSFTDSTSSFGLDLRGTFEKIITKGRSRDVTLIACTQQPVWMPSSFYSQPNLVYIGAEVDLDNEHLRDIGGNRELVRATIAQLQEHEFLCICRSPRQMWRVKVGE